MLRTLFAYDILTPKIPQYLVQYLPEEEELRLDDLQVCIKCGQMKMDDTNRFRGSDLLSWILAHEVCNSRTSSIQFAQKLVTTGAIDSNSEPIFNETLIYKLRIDTDQKGILNLFKIVSVQEKRTAQQVTADLRNIMANLRSMFMTEEGDAVDYARLRRSKEFNVEYRNAAFQLRKLNLSELDDTERKCLFINAYNALMIHALIVFGVPSNMLSKRQFFYYSKYDIGGYLFSLNDIEHGILRRDKVPFGGMMHVFTSSDPRKQFMVQILDPRIHMALNCGAKSCPPIKIYTPEKIDQQLDIAARGFCDSEVQVDEKTRTVTLSKIFQWYNSDFASDNFELAKFLIKFLDDERKNSLERMLRSVSPITVTYSEYDWSLNAKL